MFRGKWETFSFRFNENTLFLERKNLNHKSNSKKRNSLRCKINSKSKTKQRSKTFCRRVFSTIELIFKKPPNVLFTPKGWIFLISLQFCQIVWLRSFSVIDIGKLFSFRQPYSETKASYLHLKPNHFPLRSNETALQLLWRHIWIFLMEP